MDERRRLAVLTAAPLARTLTREGGRHSISRPLASSRPRGSRPRFSGPGRLAQFILLLLMFIGGCAGSTGGGIKVLRIMILLKQGSVEVKRLLHPRAVIPVRIDGRTVAPSVVASVFGFMLIYIGLLVISTLAMTAMGLDLITAFSGVAASIGNIGPGLGASGRRTTTVYSRGRKVAAVVLLLPRLGLRPARDLHPDF